MNKSTIIQIVIIVVLVVILISLIKITTDEMGMNQRFEEMMGQNGGMFEEDVEKDTSADDVESGESVTEKNINLNNYNSNFTITEAGEYTLTGEFENTILVDTKDDVTLILDGVNIKNEITAALVNKGNGSLTIKLKENTTNTLSDGGSSEYDSCIFSNGAIIIEGNGTLNVYGNQEEGEGIATETNDITINGGTINIECKDDGINAGGDGGTIIVNDGKVYIKANGDGIDSNKNLVINGGEVYTIGSSLGGDAGIDTDGGFEINGGEVIALGSDMLQSPDTTSKQKSVCFNLNTAIESGTQVTVKNDSEEVITFEAKENFKTLIVSNSKVTSGTYYLYQNGEKTSFTATVK
ncbi:MAG: carbohydrate-binding domain-containing protein [Clostridia bacterium]|nr:carbohydrate-binding domain-containing protein [Clostridia bacterium]